MFDPLIKHYQRLNNIKPSAEIASVFSGSNKRRKRLNSASDNSNYSVSQRNGFGKPRRPHSSIVLSTDKNRNLDRNNNYSGVLSRRNSSSNVNGNIGSKTTNSWNKHNPAISSQTQDNLFDYGISDQVCIRWFQEKTPLIVWNNIVVSFFITVTNYFSSEL